MLKFTKTSTDRGGGDFSSTGHSSWRKNSSGYRVMMLLFAVPGWDIWSHESCHRCQPYVTACSATPSRQGWTMSLMFTCEADKYLIGELWEKLRTSNNNTAWEHHLLESWNFVMNCWFSNIQSKTVDSKERQQIAAAVPHWAKWDSQDFKV